MKAVHYYTLPCNTSVIFGEVETTEYKDEITCNRCLHHEKLPRHSKRRKKYKKIKSIKLKEDGPKKGDHFKYVRA